MKKKLSIIILNWNGKEDTLACLASLEKQDTQNFEVLLVDNGSRDDSVEAFSKHYPHHTLILTHANLGYAGGNNLGIDHALKRGADLVLLLNNDTEMDKDFISNLLRSTDEKPEGGIFGPKVVRHSARDTLDHMGGFWSSEIGEYKPFLFNKPERDFQEMQELDYISGCSILIRREVIEKIGKLDPRFFLLWEESDFCARAKNAGFSIWATPRATLFHKVSASFEGKAMMQYYWWRNRLLWMRKNLDKSEYKKVFRRVVLKEIIKYHRHSLLKKLGLVYLKIMNPKKITEKRLLKLKRYQAGCKGIHDYYQRRFYKM